MDCYAKDIVRDCRGDVYKVSHCVKDACEEMASEAISRTSGFVVDLVSAALSEVNFDEIAEHMVADRSDSEDEDEAA
jgi:hypothetical protein